MQNLASATSGNLKLRGLLKTSRDLKRKRHLKKALNNAQIAQDFAIRSGEAPDIALAAQLLMAEIYILNASYTYDDSLKSKGWRILEQLETNGFKGIAVVPRDEIQFIKALSKRRIGEYDSAKILFNDLLGRLPDPGPSRGRALISYIASIAQSEQYVPAELFEEAKELLQFFESEDYLLYASKLAISKSICAYKNKDLPKALDSAHQALKFAEQADHPSLIAISQHQLGRLSRKRSNYGIALRLLYEAMDKAERIDFLPLLMETQLEIGKVYASLCNDREADKYFQTVATKSLEVGRTDTLYASSLALGISAQRNEDYDAANQHLTKAIQAAKTLDWTFEKGVSLAELASVKYNEGQYGLAKHLIDEAARLFTECGQEASAKTSLTQARLELVESEPDLMRVLKFAQLAADRSTSIHQREMAVEALRLKATAFEAQEEHIEALSCNKAAADLAMKLLSDQRTQHLPDLDMRAALREQEREIEKLTARNDLQTALVLKNDEIEQANRDLIQANEQLRQFAYVASHDLKEPLRQIGSYVSLIKRNYADMLDERGHTFFGFVTDGVSRLNKLFDSLMHYSAVGRIEKATTAVDLNRVMGSVEKELASNIRKADAKVVYHDLPQVKTTEKLIRHVLFALVDNAIKFKQATERPTVEISAQVEQGQYVISVRDNGIGIGDQYQDKVFVLFQMLHAKKDYPGTGVGLAIAQKTVQRLGGRIWFESNEKGQGTVFHFTLPTPVERQLTSLSSEEVDQLAA